MNAEDRRLAREERLAPRRKRFRCVEECVPLYEKPCGCPHSNHSLAMGVMSYSHSSWCMATNAADLNECRQCGAVWRQAEVEGTLAWERERASEKGGGLMRTAKSPLVIPVGTNPDVAEALRLQADSCKCPREARELRSFAVGAGGGRIGCHMEQRWVCRICLRGVMGPQWDSLFDTEKPTTTGGEGTK